MAQNRAFFSFLVTLLLALVAAPALAVVTGDGPPAARDRKFSPDELLVKFRPGVASAQAEAAARGQGAREVREFRRPRGLQRAPTDAWRVVKLGRGADLRKVRAALLRNPAVEIVEYNFEVRVALTPNDPSYPQLWGLDNTGQTGGKPNADIDAPEAWNVQTGGAAAPVAVIDTGVDYNHPDLAANMWINAGEIPGNGLDDDGNGYIDDVHGYDFCNADGDPMDDHGHGTHVAGTIAAFGDNGVGVVGVNWNARVMAVKFLCAGGSGTTSAAISAVLYAADMGARVMNNSWGGGGFSQALKDAIATAHQAGALFVAAAGNDAADTDAAPHYPSSYDVPNVVSVAATDHNDARASFSNYGAASVDLGAPGAAILSTVPASGDPCCSSPSGYKLLSGTSMATPHVAGAATLALARFPASSVLQLKQRLLGAADPIPALAGITVTGGRLNAYKALDDDSVPPSAVTDFAIVYTGARSALVSLTATGDDGMNGQASAYDLRYSTSPIDENSFEQATPAAGLPRPAAPGSHQQFKVGGLTPVTTYYFAVKVLDNVGNASGLSNVAADTTRQLAAVYQENFESGADAWSVAGSDGAGGPALWHLSTHRYASPGTAFYYGKAGALNYDTGARNFGSITSPPIDLAGIRDATLGFMHYLQVENSSVFDIARVQASNDDGATWADLYVATQSTGQMAAVERDLSAYDGQTIRLRFAFDTVDAVLNFYEGWVLDDVVVYGVSGLPNQAPTAHAGGPYSGFRNQLISFSGLGSADPDGNPLSYQWDFGDGSSGTGAQPKHAYAASGSYPVTLVVSDGVAQSAPATALVTVTNRAPSAHAGGPYNGLLKQQSMTFNGTASADPDGDALAYRWDFGDGSTGTGPTPSHAYANAGTHTVTLVVNDGETDSAPATASVTVYNQMPFALPGPEQTVVQRSLVTLDGSASFDSDGWIVGWRWRQFSGEPVTLAGADTVRPTFTAPRIKGQTPVTLYFELTVIDNDGMESFSNLTKVTVTR
ncbi:MAG: S8 family serine peptidase [Betaproteobacteria bacterium]|nr:S8 family serine peptidase [Betaproteobacteria bacterium]